MENGTVLHIDRKLPPLLDDAAMRNIAAGCEIPGEVDHITNVDVREIFGLNRGRQNFLLHQKSTSACERIL